MPLPEVEGRSGPGGVECRGPAVTTLRGESMFIKVRRSLRTIAAGAALAALCASAAGAQGAPLTKKGAEVDVRVLTALSTKTSHTGDPFAMSETDLLFVHHPELKGATIEGHLEDVVAAGPARKASMNVIFDDIKFADGSTEPISVAVKNMSAFEPKTHHLRDMGVIVGSAVVGHIVSKKTGHAGGTLAGAAAGFAIVSALKSDITIKPGTIVKLKLLHDLPQPA